MPEFKFSLTGLDGQKDYEYDYSYGNKDFDDSRTSSPSTPSTPCLDDSLKEY